MTSKTDPLISIIIPCYNKGDVVLKSVASVKKNTYSAKEILVVNDSSTDAETIASLKVLEADPEVTVLHKPNGGLSAARNYGIDRAKGEYIFFLDHDDLIVSHFLEGAVAFMEANPKIPFGYPEVIFFGERSGLKNPGEFSEEKLRVTNYIVASCVHRAAIIKKYKFDESLKVFEDWDLLLRLARDGVNGVKLPAPCYFLYRIAGTSMIGQYNSAAKRRKATRHIRQIHDIKLKKRQRLFLEAINIFYPALKFMAERVERRVQAKLFAGDPTLATEVKQLVSL